MTKAWDWQDLVSRLKANGLVMVEKEAKDATAAILDWTSESLAMGDSAIEKIAAPAVAIVKPMILNLEDGIDGIKGN
jgi:hypothetical protein